MSKYENVENNGLSTDVAFGLGGFDKKLKRDNPTSVEGYYLGTKECGVDKWGKKILLHVFLTESGKVGVWGKTNLNNLMARCVAGRMTLVNYLGVKHNEKSGNDFHAHSVGQDKTNTIDVSEYVETSVTYQASPVSEEDYSDNTGIEDDTPVMTAPITPPKQTAKTPTTEQQAKVAAMLRERKRTA